jgi:hypothetical protein
MVLEVTCVKRLPAALAVAGSPLTCNFDFYARYATSRTELFWAVAEEHGAPLGAAPVVRLTRRPATEVLRAEVRRWLGWLGPLARKTTLLVDTSFWAYDDRSPWLCRDASALAEVRRAIVGGLQAMRGVDAVWITEPAASTGWGAAAGFLQFATLPMVHVATGGCANWQEFVARQPKKRRRNLRAEHDRFAAAGGSIEVHQGPLDAQGVLTAELLACLSKSAERSELTVPYNDVLVHPAAFAAQSQIILAARAGGRLAGFMSFLQSGRRLMQCHGGLDYDVSHEVLAYHNLIAAAIGLAIERGCEVLSMGPLNNETKRRAGTDFRPMVANLWNRNPVDRWAAARFFARNFQVYRGPFPEAETPR